MGVRGFCVLCVCVCRALVLSEPQVSIGASAHADIILRGAGSRRG